LGSAIAPPSVGGKFFSLLTAVLTVVRRAARELTAADGATVVLREGDLCFYADENAISSLWKGRSFR
jgi:hypothetical protein